jgi:hypothetical protein
MATINQTGLAVLVAQLESMNELGYVQDGEPDQWIKELITEFEIPDKLIPAFIAYAEEFLQRPDGCLNESGPFWNDHDVLMGIISKFRMFYEPIVMNAHPNLNWLDSRIVIEPSYEDTTVICIVINQKCTFLDNIKAWHFWFSPEGLLDHLARIAEQIKG